MHGLLFGSLFWGILISLIGISIILKYVLNIDLHLARIFFGIILILLGMRVIFGHSERSYDKHTTKVNHYYGSGECNIIFSSGTIDLTKYAGAKKLPGEINVVFGNAVVIVPDTMNLDITSTTVFGSTILPDHSYNGFAEDTFSLKGNADSPAKRIETNTVFGRLVFEVVPSNPIGSTQAKPDTTSVKDEETF